MPCVPSYPPPTNTIPPLEVGAGKGERREVHGMQLGLGGGKPCHPVPGPERSLLQDTLKATGTFMRAE